MGPEKARRPRARAQLASSNGTLPEDWNRPSRRRRSSPRPTIGTLARAKPPAAPELNLAGTRWTPLSTNDLFGVPIGDDGHVTREQNYVTRHRFLIIGHSGEIPCRGECGGIAVRIGQASVLVDFMHEVRTIHAPGDPLTVSSCLVRRADPSLGRTHHALTVAAGQWNLRRDRFPVHGGIAGTSAEVRRHYHATTADSPA